MQHCYELAFHPVRLNELWNHLRSVRIVMDEPLGEILDTALLLHQALPAEGYASQRALLRLATCQANARAFGMVRFLENIRHRFGRPPLAATEVSGHLVRDIGLPPLARRTTGEGRR